MKATNLDEIVRYFNKFERLPKNQLDAWFVERDQTLRTALCRWMTTQSSPQGILFIGHRGSGKSTELNKLIVELVDHFNPVAFSVYENSKIHQLEIEDVLLLLVTQVVRAFTEQGLVAEPLIARFQEPWQKFWDWWRRIVSGAHVQPPPDERSLAVKLNLSVIEVENSLSRSPDTRDALRAGIRRNMPELLQYLNWIINQVEEADGRRVMIVVEDLDKISLNAALTIFRDHGALLREPNATIIYTCPSALLYSPDFHETRQAYSQTFMLPNIPPRTLANKVDSKGQKALMEMVLRRMDERLIEQKALRLAVSASGGVPTSLMRLIQNSVLYTTTSVITTKDIARAITIERELMTTPLLKDDWIALRQRRFDRELTADEQNRNLMYKGALLEYRNSASGRPWCDVHPILWDLLDDRNSQYQEEKDNASPLQG